MKTEIVVVGGGIGGLTVAALLAARGVNVALFERESRVGGCVANFEFHGFSFEPTSGLYTGWGPFGIHEQIFKELAAHPPEFRRLTPAYVVRLSDQTEIAVLEEAEAFEEILRRNFPECANAAVSFYRMLEPVVQERNGSPSDLVDEVGATYLADTSDRFHSFIDAQLEMFDHCASDRCSFVAAAFTLTAAKRGMWAIRGGAQTLAEKLAESLKSSGGSLRLNSPVLRLAYESDGSPVGIDLLSGERVIATRAIVSNLTVWDTYGKLIGLNRTPRSISSTLKGLEGRGAYSMFLGIDESAARRLPADRILLNANSESGPIMFAAAPEWDPRAPEGKRAVTVWTHADADDWFTYHLDESAHEEQDQAMLERLWPQLHAAMPELGDGVDVIETATPRTFHEATRRRLGMVGGLSSTPTRMALAGGLQRTAFRNVFLVGDTTGPGNTIEAVSREALVLANLITSQ